MIWMNWVSECEGGTRHNPKASREKNVYQSEFEIYTKSNEIKNSSRKYQSKVGKRSEELSFMERGGLFYLWLIADGMKKSANNWIKSESEDGINKKRVVGCWGMRIVECWKKQMLEKSEKKSIVDSEIFDTFFLSLFVLEERYSSEILLTYQNSKIWPKALGSCHNHCSNSPIDASHCDSIFNSQYKFPVPPPRIEHFSCSTLYYIFYHASIRHTFRNNNFDWWCKKYQIETMRAWWVSESSGLSNNLNISASNFLTVNSPVLSSHPHKLLNSRCCHIYSKSNCSFHHMSPTIDSRQSSKPIE